MSHEAHSKFIHPLGIPHIPLRNEFDSLGIAKMRPEQIDRVCENLISLIQGNVLLLDAYKNKLIELDNAYAGTAPESLRKTLSVMIDNHGLLSDSFTKLSQQLEPLLQSKITLSDINSKELDIERRKSICQLSIYMLYAPHTLTFENTTHNQPLNLKTMTNTLVKIDNDLVMMLASFLHKNKQADTTPRNVFVNDAEALIEGLIAKNREFFKDPLQSSDHFSEIAFKKLIPDTKTLNAQAPQNLITEIEPGDPKRTIALSAHTRSKS